MRCKGCGTRTKVRESRPFFASQQSVNYRLRYCENKYCSLFKVSVSTIELPINRSGSHFWLDMGQAFEDTERKKDDV